MTKPDVHISADGDVVVATIAGEVDAASAPDVLDKLSEATGAESPGLVADLGDVAYIDSGGVRMLFELHRRLTTSRRRLALVVPPTSPLRRLVDITGLGEVVDVFGTVAEGVAAAAS